MDVKIDRAGNISAWASGREAVEAGAAVLDAHIRSQTKLRLGLYFLAGAFLSSPPSSSSSRPKAARR